MFSAVTRCAACVCLCLGLYHLQYALLIEAKAAMAPFLIERAWQQTLVSGVTSRPWPWADTWPVAQLEIPAVDVRLPILASTSGEALAFAPGLHAGSVLWGEPGSAVIGGHRDTHFDFMADLVVNDRLQIQDSLGRQFRYRIAELHVIDSAHTPLVTEGNEHQVLLVTCYPLDALHAGGSLRYVAVAEMEPLKPTFLASRRSFNL